MSGFARLLILQNADFEGPGAILDWTAARGIESRVVHAYRDAEISARADEAIVALGSPTGDGESWARRESELLERAIRADRHVLGICFGAQLVARILGSETRIGRHREIGWHPVNFGNATPEIFQWHRGVFDAPAGATTLARSAATACQAFQFGARTLAFAGHPEMSAELVEAFIARCWAEPAGDEPFVHSPAEMRRDLRARAAASARFFGEILDSWRAT